LKKPNYNAAKRARELKQKAKRDAKLAKRQSRGSGAEPQPDPAAAPISEPAPSLPEPVHDPLTHPGS